MNEINGHSLTDGDAARLFVGTLDPTTRNAMWPALSEEAQRLVMKVSSVLPLEGLSPEAVERLERDRREGRERARAEDIASERRSKQLAEQIGEERERGDIARCVSSLFQELLNSDRLDDIDDLIPVVEDLLYRQTVARINGKPGAMKSFVALDLAGCVSCGIDWNGMAVTAGPVVYLVAEGDGGIKKRVRAWESVRGQKTGVLFLPRPIQVAGPEWLVLEEMCRMLSPALVVIDTQARATVGVDESSNRDMSAIFDRIERLAKESGACVLLIHHTGHAGEHGRGASNVLGAVQTEITLRKEGKGASKLITIKGSKSKDDDDDYEIRMLPRIVTVDGMYKKSGKPHTSIVLEPERQAILAIPGLTPEATAIVRQLDQCGAPIDLGRDALKRWLLQRELPVGNNNAFTAAVRYRKGRATAVQPVPEPVLPDDDDQG